MKCLDNTEHKVKAQYILTNITVPMLYYVAKTSKEKQKEGEEVVRREILEVEDISIQ